MFRYQESSLTGPKVNPQVHSNLLVNNLNRTPGQTGHLFLSLVSFVSEVCFLSSLLVSCLSCLSRMLSFPECSSPSGSPDLIA